MEYFLGPASDSEWTVQLDHLLQAVANRWSIVSHEECGNDPAYSDLITIDISNSIVELGLFRHRKAIGFSGEVEKLVHLVLYLNATLGKGEELAIYDQAFTIFYELREDLSPEQLTKTLLEP